MKKATCRICGIEKSVNDFSPEKYKNTLKFVRCKSCMVKKSQKYQKTIDGVISTSYNRQKYFSKMRGMCQPKYTKQELEVYLKNNLFFQAIYDKWVASGYDKWLRPSVDRVNDFLPYSLDNILVTTWRENFKKQNQDCKSGTGTAGLRCRAVIQTTLDGVFVAEFHSISDAKRQTGITGIDSPLADPNKTAGGYRWIYKDEPEKDLLRNRDVPRRNRQPASKATPIDWDSAGLIDTTGTRRERVNNKVVKSE